LGQLDHEGDARGVAGGDRHGLGHRESMTCRLGHGSPASAWPSPIACILMPSQTLDARHRMAPPVRKAPSAVIDPQDGSRALLHGRWTLRSALLVGEALCAMPDGVATI